MQERTTFYPPTSSGSLGLPADLLRKSRRRVRAVAILVLVGFGLDTVIFLTALVFSAVTRTPFENLHVSLRSFGAGLIAIVASVAIIVVTGGARFRDETVLRLALGFEVVLCAIISVANPWGRYVETGHLPPLTWVSPLIILFPLVIPVGPRTTAVTALLAAATAPLGLAYLHGTGKVVATAEDFVTTAFSPLVAVVFAVIASRAVHELGMDLSRARRVGSYQLVERLGEGGMGEVWKARHRLLARPAAVKLIRPGSWGGDGGRLAEMTGRFEREAQATALLRSPHTIALYDYGVSSEGAFYYVMELLEGFDTDEMVKRFGPVEPERVVHFLRQVCDSLAEAHEQGLVHRDIKPANIYACRYGRRYDFVKVLDFGLVTFPDDGGDSTARLTAPHVAAGTPAFISPEQALGNEVDGRADLYSLGCVAYWLLTGHLVFEAATPVQVIARHLNDRPTPPSERTELAVPGALEALVLSCLEKDPEKRPRSAVALDEALAPIAAEHPWSEERARRWWEVSGRGSGVRS